MSPTLIEKISKINERETGHPRNGSPCARNHRARYCYHRTQGIEPWRLRYSQLSGESEGTKCLEHLSQVSQRKQVKRNIFLTTSFLQLLSHIYPRQVFLSSYFSQCLSYNIFLTTSSQIYSGSPHNFTIYALSFSMFYAQTAVNSTIFLDQAKTLTLHMCNVYPFTV